MALRDKLLVGVRSKEVQSRMLEEEDLNLAKAERIIINREQAEERASKINGEPSRVSAVERLGSRRVSFTRDISPVYSSFRGRSRDRRGRERNDRIYNDTRSRSRSNSTPRKREYRQLYCTFCRRTGHIRKYCYDQKRMKPAVNSVAIEPKEHVFKREDLSERLRKARLSESEDEMNVLMVSSNKRNNPCMIDVEVDGVMLQMEVDSGSAVSVMCRKI
ncbi:uncharacterized protein LOC129760460 [Uranotaenia lowii]|uniref:uncharacterized protein LOC129760460 n=1 Tax=Uranotaenia lowii TaxID=190385 RepID=UPI00247AA9CC|nr:uncharacterized protein LOC129760460 [Uranotaenia lowii]